jgi:hypothetical protein
MGRMEADLVVGKGMKVLLVEVKTGFSSISGRVPETKFTHDKLKNLRKIMASQGFGRGRDVELELLAIDLAQFPRVFRRYPEVCLWLG